MKHDIRRMALAAVIPLFLPVSYTHLPDIIHCHGWMTALAPLYIKKVYKDEPSFRDAKVIFSLYVDVYKREVMQPTA